MECSLLSLYVSGAMKQSGFSCMQLNAYSLPPVHSAEAHATFMSVKICQCQFFLIFSLELLNRFLLSLSFVSTGRE